MGYGPYDMEYDIVCSASNTARIYNILNVINKVAFEIQKICIWLIETCEHISSLASICEVREEFKTLSGRFLNLLHTK